MYRNKLKALHYYASRGRYFEVLSLVNKGIDLEGKNSSGMTALICAARRSHREVVELLINFGADIHCSDNDSLTSLHHASLNGSMEIVQCLVNKGADIDKKNSDDLTPLMLAAGMGHRGVFEMLINFGADIHCCDNNGSTLLHLACSRKGDVEIVKCLVNNGASVDKKNSDDVTSLMRAAGWSSGEIVELLINFGADIHCCDCDGWAVLHHAIIGRSVKKVKFLVNKGVALDKKTSDGGTPLHLAIQSDVIECADYLLKVGADCNLEDNESRSPFNFLLLRKKPNVELIKLCIEKGAYVKSTDYNKLLNDPLLKEVILKDVKLCSQAVINKFNNKDLPLLYQGLASAQKLPHIDKMKIRNGSGMAIEVEQAVAHEIKAKGFCNLFKMVPLALGILCVKSSIENSIPAFNRANLSQSQDGLKRLGSCTKLEHPCKKLCNQCSRVG